MKKYLLAAALVLACAPAAHAEGRGIYQVDDMKTARADVRANKRLPAVQTRRPAAPGAFRPVVKRP
jgi:hypothetical protein